MFQSPIVQTVTAFFIALTAALPFYRRFLVELTKLVSQLVKLVVELRHLVAELTAVKKHRRPRRRSRLKTQKGPITAKTHELPSPANAQSRDG